MKILVIGDLHLTDKFDERKYEYLVSLINKSKKVILNGDFYDGVLVSFERFVNSEWKKLFPLLKSKKTIYIIGNHDYDSYPRVETDKFSDEKVYKYEFLQNSKKFYITHGQMFGLTIIDNVKLIRQIKAVFWEPIYEYVMGKLVRKWGNKVLSFGSNSNKIIERNIRKIIPKEVVVLYSDSHCQSSNNNENIYNTGIFNYGIAQYAIIESGKVVLYNERY